MRATSAKLYLAAVGLLLGTGLTARADLVPWTYTWDRNPIIVAAGTGGVTLTNEPLTPASGNSDIVATNLKVVSSADPATPDVLKNGSYKLTLNLTDSTSGATGSLTFGGMLTGTFSKGSSQLMNVFTGTTTQSLVLGGNTYTVTIGPYSPPGPPTEALSGSIGATVTVTAGSNTHGTPEPCTAVLAGLGLSFAGLTSWRLRRRRPVAA
jgi:hypothetical protein